MGFFSILNFNSYRISSFCRPASIYHLPRFNTGGLTIDVQISAGPRISAYAILINAPFHVCTKMASVSSGRKCANNSYDLSFKLRAIAVAEKSSKSTTARVDVRRIREWCSQRRF